jgi:predicted O-linked N-acetylglucosamine transferase (SPINDLY family)
MPPRAAEAAFAEALRQLEAGRLSLADKACRRLLQLAPRHAEGLNLQGVVKLRLGQPDAAAEAWRQAVSVAPEVAQYRSNLGAALLKARRFDAAEQAFAAAMALAPEVPELAFNRAAALKELGRLEAAVGCYQAALALRPDYPEACHNLATALEALGRPEEAEAASRRALALRPDWAEALTTLGIILNRRHRPAEALACLQRAVALKPDHAEALARLAGLLLFLRRPAEAEPVCRRALALRPDHPELLAFLAHARRELGDTAEALALYARAMAREPHGAPARLEALVATLPILPRDAAEAAAAPAAFTQALAALEGWAATDPAARLPALGRILGRVQPFELAYRAGNLRAPLARHGALMARAAAALPAPPSGAPPRRGRLRLIACTAHIRRHPVWDVVLKGIVGGLDRRRFEVILYHTHAETDAETAWAASQADGFVQGPRELGDWLGRLATDRPDILLYPEIGMDPVSFGLAARRLAPLQVTSWGHPVTSGLPEIDLFLSGALLEGPGAEAHYTERLLRLPGTGVCTTWPGLAAAPAEGLDLPEDRGIARLVLPHMPFKLDPAHDALIARAARAAAPCRLWLPRSREYPWATERLLARLGAALAAEGLDPAATLRVFPWQSPERFLGLLDAMDVYLDAPAFSGYTTAWAAAHRGLPIVAREGEFLRQRLAAGLLRRIGQDDTITETEQDVVALTAMLAAEARDPARRAARRQAIRAAAPRADGDLAPIRALEEALLREWEARRG